jgi:hypothetical protein
MIDVRFVTTDIELLRRKDAASRELEQLPILRVLPPVGGQPIEVLNPDGTTSQSLDPLYVIGVGPRYLQVVFRTGGAVFHVDPTSALYRYHLTSA